MSEGWIVQSTSDISVGYWIEVNADLKTVICTCKGFQTHKRCKHIKFYKKLIRALMHETSGVKSEKGGK